MKRRFAGWREEFMVAGTMLTLNVHPPEPGRRHLAVRRVVIVVWLYMAIPIRFDVHRFPRPHSSTASN